MKNKHIVLPGALLIFVMIMSLCMLPASGHARSDAYVAVGFFNTTQYALPASGTVSTPSWSLGSVAAWVALNPGYTETGAMSVYVQYTETSAGNNNFGDSSRLQLNGFGSLTGATYACVWSHNGVPGSASGAIGMGTTNLFHQYESTAFAVYVSCVVRWSNATSAGGDTLTVSLLDGVGLGGTQTITGSWSVQVDETDATRTPTIGPTATNVPTNLLEDGNMEEYPLSESWSLDTYRWSQSETTQFGRMNDAITATSSIVSAYLGSPYCDAGQQVLGPVVVVSGTEVIPDPDGDLWGPITQEFSWGGGTIYYRFAARYGAAGMDVPPTAPGMFFDVGNGLNGFSEEFVLTPGWRIYEGSESLPSGVYDLDMFANRLNVYEFIFIDDVQLGITAPTGHCGGGTGIGGQDEFSLLVDGGFELNAAGGMQYWISLPAYSFYPIFGRSVAQDLWWLNNYGGYQCGSQYQVVDFGSQGPSVGKMYPIRQRFSWPGGRLYYQAAARSDYRGTWGLGTAVGVYLTGSAGTYWLEQNRSVGHAWTWLVGSKDIPAGEYYFNLNQGSPAGTDPSGVYDVEFDEVAIGTRPFSGSCYTNGGAITPTPVGTVTPTPTLNPTNGINIQIGDCSFENFNEFWVYAPGSWWTDYDYSPNQYILGNYFAVADGELPRPIYQTVFIPRSGMIRARFWSKSTYQLILVPKTALSVPVTLATGGTYAGDTGEWQEIVTDPVFVNVPAAGMYADLVLSRDPAINGVYTQYTAMYDGVVLNVGPAPYGSALLGTCGSTNTPAPTYTPAPTLTPQGTFTATPSTRTPGPPGQNVADCDRKCNKPSGFGLEWVVNWLDYERCQMEYYAAWCPFHSATLVAVPTTFAGKEPFGMIVEVEESRGTVEAQVGGYDWNSAGIPGMEDQPDPNMFLVSTAVPDGRVGMFYSADTTPYVSPYNGGQIVLSPPQGYGKSVEAMTYGTYCNVQLTDVIGSRLAVGACFGFNILRQLAILPWFQFFINLSSVIGLYFYIKTAWIDKGVG